MRTTIKHLILIVVTLSSILLYGANNAESNSVWIRPVIVDTITSVNNPDSAYRLFKDSYVQVRDKKNGDIIIGNDTLQTDNIHLTEYSKGRQVSKKEIDEYYQVKKYIKNINDSILIFAFADLNNPKGPENYRLYINSDNTVHKNLSCGVNDTLRLADAGMAHRQIIRIVLVPDTSLALYIPYEDIARETSAVSDVTEAPADSESAVLPLWVIILIVVLGIGIVIVAVFYFYILSIRKNEDEEGCHYTTKLIKKLDSANTDFDKIKRKTDNFILGTNSQIGEKHQSRYNEFIENLSKSMNSLYSLIKVNIHIISKDEFDRCITQMQNVAKDLKVSSKIKDTNNLESYLNDLDTNIKCINKLIESVKESAKNNKEKDNASNMDSYYRYDNIASDVNADPIIVLPAKKEGVPDIKEVPEDVQNHIELLRKENETYKKESDIIIDSKDDRYHLLYMDLESERKTSELLRVQLQNAEGKLAIEKKEREDIIKKKVNEIEEDCKEKIRRAEKTAEKIIDAANVRVKRAEEKTRTISDELNAKFDVERKAMMYKQKELAKALKETEEALGRTKSLLHNTEDSLAQALRQVQNLTVKTELFHKHLSDAVESMPYCEGIMKLIDLANRIQESASGLLQSDMEDKYFVYKPMALYIAKLNTIKMQNFYTDVEMVARTGFVIKGTPLASYDSKLSKAELASMTRNYFFTNYLKTYFDAIVVLNESLAGLPYLVEDVKNSEVRVFGQYRLELEETARKLGINVLTVKVYDSVGINTDLLATEIDAGIEKHGAILEIENCKVSLIGGAPNTERIKVKIQK